MIACFVLKWVSFGKKNVRDGLLTASSKISSVRGEYEQDL